MTEGHRLQSLRLNVACQLFIHETLSWWSHEMLSSYWTTFFIRKITLLCSFVWDAAGWSPCKEGKTSYSASFSTRRQNISLRCSSACAVRSSVFGDMHFHRNIAKGIHQPTNIETAGESHLMSRHQKVSCTLTSLGCIDFVQAWKSRYLDFPLPTHSNSANFLISEAAAGMVMRSFPKIDLTLGRRRRNLPCLQSAAGDTKGLETRSCSCL